jgi:hypothetical protein
MSFSKRQWLFPIVITIQNAERARNPSHVRLYINSVGKQVPSARPIHVKGYVLH